MEDSAGLPSGESCASLMASSRSVLVPDSLPASQRCSAGRLGFNTGFLEGCKCWVQPSRQLLQNEGSSATPLLFRGLHSSSDMTLHLFQEVSSAPSLVPLYQIFLTQSLQALLKLYTKHSTDVYSPQPSLEKGCLIFTTSSN